MSAAAGFAVSKVLGGKGKTGDVVFNLDDSMNNNEKNKEDAKKFKYLAQHYPEVSDNLNRTATSCAKSSCRCLTSSVRVTLLV